MAPFEPRWVSCYGPRRSLAGQMEIRGDMPAAGEVVNRFLMERVPDRDRVGCLGFYRGIPDRLRGEVEQTFADYRGQTEPVRGQFVMEIANEVSVYAEDDFGLFAGAATLVRMTEQSWTVQRGLVCDRPTCDVRGLKLYLPAQDDIEYFKSVVDMLWYYRFNTIMLEVGGAMEYRRHPEINEGWVEYCAEMSEYSGKTNIIQEHTYGWYKNSIHVENGGGRYLEQSAVRDIVAYCRARGLEVIPEVPSLSHCDYLLTRHPELAERADDPYPDTYCPSNPASYQLLFDVLGEILEVFEPAQVNIGHDEYYSILVCDRCRDRAAHEVFAEDVIRIHDFLTERGVATMMWGEKLLSKGGSEVEMYQAWDREHGAYQGRIPATREAIDLVPRDITMLHWYWKHQELEQEYQAAGFPYVFGNFHGSMFPEWPRRIEGGARGAIISNWSSVKEVNLRRNGVLFDIVFASRMFWDPSYGDPERCATMEATFTELSRYHLSRRLEGRTLRPASARHATHLRVRHTTDRRFEYRQFVDGRFIEPESYTLGAYVLEYDRGSPQHLQIVYGDTISTCAADWAPEERCLAEVSGLALPYRDGQSVWYETVLENPDPSREIRSVGITLPANAGWHVEVRSVEFLTVDRPRAGEPRPAQG